MCQAIKEMIDEAVAEKEEAIQEMMAEKERAIQEAIAEKEAEAEQKNIEKMKRMINSKKQFAFEDIAEIFGVSVEFVENMAKG